MLVQSANKNKLIQSLKNTYLSQHAVTHIKQNDFLGYRSADISPDQAALALDGALYIAVDRPVAFRAAVVREAEVRRVRVAAFRRHPAPQTFVVDLQRAQLPSTSPARRPPGGRRAPLVASSDFTTAARQLAYQHFDVGATRCTVAVRQRSADVFTTCQHTRCHRTTLRCFFPAQIHCESKN